MPGPEINVLVPDDFAREFAELYRDEAILPIHATPYAWWALVNAVQLASRHPEAMKALPMRHAVEMARAIGERIASRPALARVMAQGWDQTHDC